MTTNSSKAPCFTPPDSLSQPPPYEPFIRAAHTESGSWLHPTLPWVATDEAGRDFVQPRPQDPNWRPSSPELDWLFLSERLQTQRLCMGVRAWEVMLLSRPDTYTPDTDAHGRPFQAFLDRTTMSVDESTWFSLFRRDRWSDFEGEIPGWNGRKWHCASDDEVWARLRVVLELANRFMFRALESDWLRALLDPRTMELVRDVWVGARKRSNVLRFKPRHDGLTHSEATAIFEHLTRGRVYFAVHDKDHAIMSNGSPVCAYCVNVDDDRSWISIDTRVLRPLFDPATNVLRDRQAHNSMTAYRTAQLICHEVMHALQVPVSKAFMESFGVPPTVSDSYRIDFQEPFYDDEQVREMGASFGEHVFGGYAVAALSELDGFPYLPVNTHFPNNYAFCGQNTYGIDRPWRWPGEMVSYFDPIPAAWSHACVTQDFWVDRVARYGVKSLRLPVYLRSRETAFSRAEVVRWDRYAETTQVAPTSIISGNLPLDVELNLKRMKEVLQFRRSVWWEWRSPWYCDAFARWLFTPHSIVWAREMLSEVKDLFLLRTTEAFGKLQFKAHCFMAPLPNDVPADLESRKNRWAMWYWRAIGFLICAALPRTKRPVQTMSGGKYFWNAWSFPGKGPRDPATLVINEAHRQMTLMNMAVYDKKVHHHMSNPRTEQLHAAYYTFMFYKAHSPVPIPPGLETAFDAMWTTLTVLSSWRKDSDWLYFDFELPEYREDGLDYGAGEAFQHWRNLHVSPPPGEPSDTGSDADEGVTSMDLMAFMAKDRLEVSSKSNGHWTSDTPLSSVTSSESEGADCTSDESETTKDETGSWTEASGNQRSEESVVSSTDGDGGSSSDGENSRSSSPPPRAMMTAYGRARFQRSKDRKRRRPKLIRYFTWGEIGDNQRPGASSWWVLYPNGEEFDVFDISAVAKFLRVPPNAQLSWFAPNRARADLPLRVLDHDSERLIKEAAYDRHARADIENMMRNMRPIGRALQWARREDVAARDGMDGRRAWIYIGNDVFDITNVRLPVPQISMAPLLFDSSGGSPSVALFQEGFNAVGVANQILRDYRVRLLKPARSAQAVFNVYAEEELAAYRKLKAGLYVVINSRVYDLTKYFESHPGGSQVLLGTNHGDETQNFNLYHHDNRAEILKDVEHLCIGRFVPMRQPGRQPGPSEVVIYRDVYDLARLDPKNDAELLKGLSQFAGYGVSRQVAELAKEARTEHPLFKLHLRKDAIIAKIPKGIMKSLRALPPSGSVYPRQPIYSDYPIPSARALARDGVSPTRGSSAPSEPSDDERETKERLSMMSPRYDPGSPGPVAPTRIPSAFATRRKRVRDWLGIPEPQAPTKRRPEPLVAVTHLTPRTVRVKMDAAREGQGLEEVGTARKRGYDEFSEDDDSDFEEELLNTISGAGGRVTFGGVGERGVSGMRENWPQWRMRKLGRERETKRMRDEEGSVRAVNDDLRRWDAVEGMIETIDMTSRPPPKDWGLGETKRRLRRDGDNLNDRVVRQSYRQVGGRWVAVL